MAINYTNLGAKLGKLVKKYRSLTTLAGTTLPADLQEIVAAYGTASTGTTTAQSAIEGLHSQYVGLMQTVTSMRLSIAAFADTTLADYDTIVSQLAGSDFSVGSVLPLLIVDMVDNGQTVERSVVTVGSATPNSRNVGNGTVVVGKVLDGFNPPLSGGFSHPLYAGVDSELHPASATHTFRCVSDSYQSGGGGGATFEWVDGVDFGEASAFPEGVGSGPSLNTADQESLVSNGDFEGFSGTGAAQTIASWDVTAGTTGTHVAVDEGAPYFGDGCLRLTGDGSVKPYLSQSISVSPLRMYLVSFRARLAGAGDASVLTVWFSGTKFDGSSYDTATGSGSLATPTSSFTGSWALYTFPFLAPLDVPAGLEMHVGFHPSSAAPGAGVSVLIDNLFAVPVDYHAGVSAVVIPGSVPFAEGDRITVSVTSVEKILQNFFRQHYRCQLPSAPAGTLGYYGLLPMALFTAASSATLADSLAT